MSNKIIKPTFSIGIPVYNGQNFIKFTLISILKQTYKNFEVIVSDNNSNDKTITIIKELMKKDKRIKLFQNKNSIKVVENFKKTLLKADGIYFMWLSHDDYIDKHYLMTIKKKIKLNTAMFGVVNYVDSRNNLIKKIQNNYVFYFQGNNFIKKMKYLFYPSLSGKMILFFSVFNTNKLKKNLKYLHNYIGDRDYFDMPFVYQSLSNFNFVGLKNIEFYKRIHSQNESFIYGKNKSNIIIKLLRHLFTIKSYITFLNISNFKNKLIIITITPFGYIFHLIGNLIILFFYFLNKIFNNEDS